MSYAFLSTVYMACAIPPMNYAIGLHDLKFSLGNLSLSEVNRDYIERSTVRVKG
jgi:hypothetical protein